ncbi:CAP domain-containing protein [Dolichospermum circinale]|uniref:CAP domain-containing protein n=1 Tax=Dolichospermum circinale TaxID=109265 RepID=UPI00047F9FB3|nr:CAP domain-containing protein [Dolichospermum circinale]MDB9473354.1 CAP domain-containing protein [Dolichospermum circinale CS-537/11]MDB9480572.1 CAP domain-containing protein [Dolichospermum circinale CS-537/03]MDB9481138.1 CAP domain-containing protein [Dolichospermum circinale CS-537/05]
MDVEIQRVFDLLNNERFRAGLSLLRLNSQLIAAAQAHSNDMARHNYLNHTGSDGSSMVDRMTRYGYNYRWAGENIAYGQTSAQEVMQSWMNSAGHRKNILNPKFRDVGIVYAYGNTFYWTQNFGA